MTASAEILTADEATTRAFDVPGGVKMRVQDLSAGFASTKVLSQISLDLPVRAVTAVIGPSGCGKSTFIRCLNRMHELVDNAHVTGRVLLDSEDIYAPRMDPVLVRRRVGMVFQRPNPFPTLSIRDNVLVGRRLAHLDEADADELMESCLQKVALWDEVKDRLHRAGTSLSGGQQQRLCIARALALDPEVLLMDEPCSALDPTATAAIEELIHELRSEYTVGIVTHNLSQAARVSDFTAFFYMGKLVEYAATEAIFTNPRETRTEDYITGRFG